MIRGTAIPVKVCGLKFWPFEVFPPSLGFPFRNFAIIVFKLLVAGLVNSCVILPVTVCSISNMRRIAMNIVDLIKDQLMGAAGKQLGGLIGAEGKDVDKLVGAGLPSILSGLKGLASTPSGADKLASSIKGMDSSMFGDVGKLLGSASGAGGGLLSGLIGGKVMETIGAVIAKFTGLSPTLVKTGLTFLGPLIMGSIGSKLGGKVDGPSISRFFDDQKDNIANAMPQGLNLASVPGLEDLYGAAKKAAPSVSMPQASAPSGGIGKLLVPLALLAALAAAGWFMFNRPEAPKQGTQGVTPERPDGNYKPPFETKDVGQPTEIKESTGLPPPTSNPGLPPASNPGLPPAGGTISDEPRK
jgi:hypothetical protein